MKNLKGSQTEKNLIAAFAGESQARNRYTYFASRAKKEGFEQISAIFHETADNEKEHAKRFFQFLQGGEVEVVAAFPAGVVGTTAENLKSAAAGENMEHSSIYPEFARIAEEEGFKDVAFIFRKISEVEKHHEERYLKLFKNIEDSSVFKKESALQWKCRNCGYIHEGTEAPEMCPACAHAKAYFEVLADIF